MTARCGYVLVVLAIAGCSPSRPAATLPPAVLEGAPAAPVALEVAVVGLRSDAGAVAVALYASAAGFPGDAGKAVARATASPHDRSAMVRFDALAPGTYAVAVLHDEDGNGQLDTGLFGIPKEGLGASNDAQGGFSAASFDDAKLAVRTDARIRIKVRYFP